MGIITASSADVTTWATSITDVLVNGELTNLATPTRIAGVTTSGFGYGRGGAVC
ncbi:MAG: hypothetical protein KTR21_09355 [Rhodobacteraceae bacterium]|nr:hypothetical protein [Paracoccaceae bacterium]